MKRESYMAEKNAFNSINKDSMDINELASLNDDISPELIDQLQQKLTQDAQSMGCLLYTSPSPRDRG